MQRIVYIDYLKAFAIFLVILGHTIQQIAAHDALFSRLFAIIYSFHMPLFMAISGYFLQRVLDKGMRFFLIHRSRQLLLPVLSFATVVFACRALGWFDVTEGKTFWGYLGGGDMWFLKTLFACTLIALVSRLLFRRTLIAALLPSTVLMLVSRVGLAKLLPYLWLGYALHRYHHHLERHARTIAIVCGVVLAIALPHWQLEYDFPYYKAISLSHGFHLSLPHLGIILFRTLVGTAGCLLCFALFSLLSHTGTSTVARFFHRAGTRTLGMYCLQIYLLEDLLHYLHFMPQNRMVLLVAVPVIAVAEWLLCDGIALLMERNRVTALLFLGQWRKK